MFAARILAEKKHIKESYQFKTTVNPEDLCDMFIHGSPPEFTNIKQNIDDLPSSWNLTDIGLLIPIAKLYLKKVMDLCADNELFRSQKKAFFDPQKTKIQSTPSDKNMNKAQPDPNKPPTQLHQFSSDPKDVKRHARLSELIHNGVFKFAPFFKEVGTDTCVWYGGTNHSTHQCCAVKLFLSNANLATNKTVKSYLKSIDQASQIQLQEGQLLLRLLRQLKIKATRTP